MKTLIFIAVFIFMCVSCKKDNDSGSARHNITIKGSIGTSKKGTDSKSPAQLPLSDASKVFVVNLAHGFLNSSFVDIINGSFTDNTEIGTATAMVFLDGNNKYIGTLSSRGLNILPLNNLSHGDTTTIDLSVLNLEGTSVIPTHDPFGDGIVISDAEISRLKEVDGFFESLAKNIDADNDNILDVLSDKQLFLKTRFGLKGDHWGLNDSPPVISDSGIDNLTYTLELNGGLGYGHPNSVVLTGPADLPYNDISTIVINSDGNGGFYSVIHRNGGLFKQGTYTVSIDGSNCTLDYSNIDAQQNLLYVLPTLHTNSSGQLVSISFEYKLPDGTLIDPVNILTDVMVQFTNSSQIQYYDTQRLVNPGTSTQHCDCVQGLDSYTLPSPLDISDLAKVTVGYNDLLGNTYLIDWAE